MFEAKEESDVEVSDELSRLLEQDEKTIQSFEEQVELGKWKIILFIYVFCDYHFQNKAKSKNKHQRCA